MENMNDVNEINYAEVVEKRFKDKEMHFQSQPSKNGGRLFTLPMQAENAPGITLRMRIAERGDVKIWSYLASSVPKGKRRAVLEAINRLNCRFRYACFSLDQDNDVCASYDFNLFGDAETAGKQVLVTMFLVANIVDESLPDILPVLWKKREDDEIDSEDLKNELFEEESTDTDAPSDEAE